MTEFFLEAARILQEVDSKRDSFRNLVFQSKYENKKALFKVCDSILKGKSTLREILSERPELEYHEQFADNPYLLLVLLHELLYGRGLKLCPSHLKKPLMEHQDYLLKSKGRIDLNQNGEVKEDSNIPRYARVNTLKCTLEQVIEWLEEDGCYKIDISEETREGYLKRINELKDDEFCVDPDLENIVVFAPGTDLHDYRLVAFNCLILQDKSSCLSALCLAPSPNDVVMDVCAAPGMKTSHLAALMENKGQIFAIDKDPNRVGIMKFLLEQKCVTCAEVMCGDFLDLDLKDKNLEKVTHLLLDPPCSGSGIVNRGDMWTYTGKDFSKEIKRRSNSLGNLQAMMLKKVFNAEMPNLRRVVYSTCSIYERENEVVIEEALETAEAHGFKLVMAMESWKHRGKKEHKIGEFCLRADRKTDSTNGFFVAVFEKS